LLSRKLKLCFIAVVGMQFEVVEEGDCFLVRFADKEDFELDFEFTPAGLGDFEGRGLDCCVPLT
jgi:hypothetical protein